MPSEKKRTTQTGEITFQLPKQYQFIRNTYFQTKKQYKNMIKLKKRNSREEKLKLLASIGNNDMKQKWEIIKSITDADSNKEDPAKEKDLKRWKDYFQDLYNSNETNDNLPKSFDYKGNQIGQILKT